MQTIKKNNMLTVNNLIQQQVSMTEQYGCGQLYAD